MSNQNQSAQDMIQAALRRAEMQNMQMAAEVRFRENMEMFKKVSPDLCEQYSNYQPKELRLSWDDAGYLNLVNYQLNNDPVYPEDPQIFCKKQVEQFIDKPSITSIRFGTSKVPDPRQIHPRIINDLIEKTEPMVENIKPRCDVPIPSLLMCGIGLGYQIPYLIEKTDIKNLIIFDPHKDSFYASLHVVDWRPILTYFCQEGKMIKLLIGADPEASVTEVKLLTDRIGLHKIVYTFVYRHFNSKEAEAFHQRYIKEFHLSAGGTGYLDDEQNGLAHTIGNLKNEIPLFKHSASPQNLPPLLMIGNGPSLDLFIDFLRDNREKVILMSCGTAISSLEKVGIKPDFHIEMERNYNVKDWLTFGTTPEFRKGIKLLCLNTVSPSVIELFDEVCMAKKINDIGASIIDETVPGMRHLTLCNPTVTNAGTAFATAMGFEEIYLIGVDLGTPEDKHHSSLSVYHDIEKITSRNDITVLANKAREYRIKGNFCDTIVSNFYLDATRINMQLLIRTMRFELPNLKVYNPNLGAFIEGTIPIHLKDIPAFDKVIDKKAVIAAIEARNFVKYDNTVKDDETLKEKYLKDFFDTRKTLMLPKDIRDANELYTLLDKKIMSVINKGNDHPVTAMLLRGSLQGYFSLMMKTCLFQTSPKAFKDAYSLIRKGYIEFLDLSYKKMELDPFKQDDNPDSIMKEVAEKRAGTSQ